MADDAIDVDPAVGHALGVQQANQRLATLDAQYPSASSAITAERTAITDTAGDLQNLANINQTIDVGPWRESFNAHIAALATASNALRTQLGLPATTS